MPVDVIAEALIRNIHLAEMCQNLPGTVVVIPGDMLPVSRCIASFFFGFGLILFQFAVIHSFHHIFSLHGSVNNQILTL